MFANKQHGFTLDSYLKILLIRNFSTNHEVNVICTASFHISKLVKIELLNKIVQLPLWCRPAFTKDTIRETIFSGTNNCILIINNPRELRSRTPDDIVFYEGGNNSKKDTYIIKSKFDENLSNIIRNKISFIRIVS